MAQPEIGHDRRQQVRRRRGARRQHEGTEERGVGAGDLVHRPVDLGEGARTRRDQGLAFACRPGGLADAFEELRAELLLEQANVIADGRLGEAEHLGGGGEAAQSGHFAQRPQAFQAGKMAARGVHGGHSFRNDFDQKQQFLK